MTAVATHTTLTREQERGVGRRAIETEDFPFEYLSTVATAESWRKEVNRPIYHLHKWWAQRLDSVFRSLILGAGLPADADVAAAFALPTRLPELVIFDSFMGSGTTVDEALKLELTTEQRTINMLHLATRVLAERGNSLLKTTFKALRWVSLCPWRIGPIIAAALVLLHTEHNRTT